MAAPTRKEPITLILLVLCIQGCISFLDDDFDVISDSVLTVEHSFGAGESAEFTKRGTITVQSIKSGVADFNQDKPLSVEEKHKLQELAAEDSVYRIRISSRSSDGSTPFVSSFVKACALYEAQLTNTITVHMDQSGNVIGVSLTTPTIFCEGSQVNLENVTSFKTNVEVIQTIPGPVPETQSYVEKIDRDKEDKAKGQQADNRSFLGKYWMYIVPVVILMMFANNADPNAGQTGAR